MDRASADRHRFLFHLQYIALPNILLAVFLAARLPRWVHYLVFAGFLSVSIAALHLRTGYAWMDYSMGSTLGGFALNAFHLLVLADPIEQYRHKSDNPELGPKGLSWWRRVYWSWSVILSSRGIGWNYQIKYVPPMQRTSRIKFLFFALKQLFLLFFLVDLAEAIIITTPFLRNLPLDVSIRSLKYYQQTVCIAAWVLGTYAGVAWQYYLAAFLCVSTGISSPEDWPAPFGDLSDAYSVKTFWGKFWHQTMRRFIVAPGKKLTQLLKVPQKSKKAAFVQLYTAFFLSGMLHSVGDYMVGREQLGKSLPFFIAQAVAITLEERMFNFLAARSNVVPAPAARTLGYFWVMVWLLVSAPLLIDPARKFGFLNEEMIPDSPIRSAIAFFHHS